MKIKLAVAASDSSQAELIRRLVNGLPDYKIAWIQTQIRQIIQNCLNRAPDILILDAALKDSSGKSVAALIIEKATCPVLVVDTQAGQNASAVFNALGLGAADTAVIYESAADSSKNSDLAKALSRISRLNDLEPAISRQNEFEPELSASSRSFGLILTGASSGGPSALVEILGRLPKKLNAAMVIAQHIDSGNADSMAGWLDSKTALNVRIARDAESPQPGTVLLAGENGHLAFNSRAILSYTPASGKSIVTPSIDIFFKSAVNIWPAFRTTAILLSGMGSDGARGLLELKKSGVSTIVQSPETAEITGMPASALKLNAACSVLSPREIAKKISNRFAF